MRELYKNKLRRNKGLLFLLEVFYSLVLHAILLVLFNLSPVQADEPKKNAEGRVEIRLMDNVEPISVFLQDREKIANVKRQLALLRSSNDFDFLVYFRQQIDCGLFPGYENFRSAGYEEDIVSPDGEKYFKMDAFVMNENAYLYNGIPEKVVAGKGFIEQDYRGQIKQRMVIPAVLGFEYQQVFHLRDTFESFFCGIPATYQVVGFLEQFAQTKEGSKPLDKAMIIPALEFEQASMTDEEQRVQGIFYLQMISGTAILQSDYNLSDFYNELESYRMQTNGILLDMLMVSVYAQDMMQMGSVLETKRKKTCLD